MNRHWVGEDDIVWDSIGNMWFKPIQRVDVFGRVVLRLTQRHSVDRDGVNSIRWWDGVNNIRWWGSNNRDRWCDGLNSNRWWGGMSKIR
jgi:hypothetical protein